MIIPCNSKEHLTYAHQTWSRPTAMGVVPKAFLSYITRESQSSCGEMVMSLKQITITINLLHVICWLGAHGTRPGFHCTQVNCSQNRYDIKDMLFACGRCWIQSRRAPTDCLQVSCTIKLCVCCIFRISLKLFIGQGNWDQSRGMVGDEEETKRDD